MKLLLHQLSVAVYSACTNEHNMELLFASVSLRICMTMVCVYISSQILMTEKEKEVATENLRDFESLVS